MVDVKPHIAHRHEGANTVHDYVETRRASVHTRQVATVHAQHCKGNTNANSNKRKCN